MRIELIIRMKRQTRTGKSFRNYSETSFLNTPSGPAQVYSKSGVYVKSGVTMKYEVRVPPVIFCVAFWKTSTEGVSYHFSIQLVFRIVKFKGPSLC